jgi:ribosomal protein L7/L12
MANIYNEMISLLRAHENGSTQAIKDSIADALKLAFNAIVNDQASIDVRIIAEYNSAEGRCNIASIRVARDLMGLGLKDAKDYAEGITGHAEYRHRQDMYR